MILKRETIIENKEPLKWDNDNLGFHTGCEGWGW
jgi:hypothetical protein